MQDSKQVITDIAYPLLSIADLTKVNLPIMPKLASPAQNPLSAWSLIIMIGSLWISTFKPSFLAESITSLVSFIVPVTILVTFVLMLFDLRREQARKKSYAITKHTLSPLILCGEPVFKTRSNTLDNLITPLDSSAKHSIHGKEDTVIKNYLKRVKLHRELVFLDEYVIEQYWSKK